MAGHPALCKHIFTPAHHRLFKKIEKEELANLMFQGGGDPNYAMLYTGDDERWQHARQAWSPFFMTTDFACYDEMIDEIMDMHLLHKLKYRQGKTELLELMLYVVIDLLCRVLYGANLSQDELNILVESLAEYTVPSTPYRGKYPGGLSCYKYHYKVAQEISDKCPDGCFAKVIMGDEQMSQQTRYDNCAFFFEALTPAFASFWTICNVLLKSSTDKNIKQQCLEDPIFREKCIKESLRMYPPVPTLWGRVAKETHSFSNPLYDEKIKDERGLLSKVFGAQPDIRTVESITIKKDTVVMVIPAVFHYDDRFWMQSEEFLPSRWDKDPHIINENFTIVRNKRASVWASLSIAKDDDAMTKITEEISSMKKKVAGYEADTNPIRYKLFGETHEKDCEEENFEHLKVAADAEGLLSWSFFPFGLGKHMCLGRRLAVKFVDGMVSNLLSYDIKFENGVTPNMFKCHWSDRLNAVSAVYNYPADPVYIEFADAKSAINRIGKTSIQSRRMTKRQSIVSVIPSILEEDQSKAAVLFISCQNEFLDEEKGKLFPKVEAVMAKLGTRKNLARIMEAAINSKALIIHAPVGIEAGKKYNVSGLDENKLAALPDVFTLGTWGAELYKDTGASSDDIILNGRSTNDLTTESRLMSELKNSKIELIFVCGLLTDVTVEQTVLSLAKKVKGGMSIHPVSDATASYTMEAQNITFKTVLSKYSKPVTTDDAIEMLETSLNTEDKSLERAGGVRNLVSGI